MTRLQARVLALVAVSFLTMACQSFNPRPAAVVWHDRVPTPAPEAVASQPVVARSSNTITLLPISPTGAQIEIDYGYEMPHCGIGSPIDVDGSFWDAVTVPADPVEFDGTIGTFRLVTATRATFTTRDGRVLQLTRREGAKEFHFCF